MVTVKQFLTKTKPSANTSVFRYSPVLPTGKLEIYSLISISNTAGVETSRFNKFVWDGFLDGFLSKDEEIITRLKNALVASEFKLKELIRHDSALEEKGVDLNLSVLIFKENKVFVGILGDHKVFFYKKKMVDLSSLLVQNKSSVGSTIASPSDFFVVFYGAKDLATKVKGLSDVAEISGVLESSVEKDETIGGGFVASFPEEEKTEVVVVPPLEKTNEEEVEEELPEREEEEEKEVSDVKAKLKAFAGLVWLKLKMVLDKVVVFLSEKFSKILEKMKFSLRDRYGRKRWYKKLQSNGSVRRLSQGFKPFKVDAYKDKELRMRRFVMVFVLLLLVFAVFFGVRSAFEARQRSLLAKELNVLMEDWDGSLEKANSKALDDSEVSLSLVASVGKDLDEYLDGLKEVGKLERLSAESREQIATLEERLVEIRDKANRIVGLSEKDGNLTVLLDTKLLFGDKSDPVNFVISKGSQIVGGEFLYLVDAGENAVYEIPLDGGDHVRVNDPKGLLKSPMFIDLGNNRDNEGLYVYDSESGALRAGRDENGKFNNFVSLSGLTPRVLGGEGVTAFAVFGPTDSLNFVVPAESKLVRAVSFGGVTYNLPSTFISHPSFEKGLDLFGDQYIYVLSTTPNGIKRFVPATGLNSQLTVTGLQSDLNSITTGYTGAYMDRTLVLFDSEIKRFVQFSKPIEMGQNLVHPNEIVLKSQYEYRGERSDVFNDVKDVVVTDDDKYMYVLDDRKIWKITLEN